MPSRILAQSLLLRELHLVKVEKFQHRLWICCQKRSQREICPKCATPSSTLYDKRIVRVKDSPVRNHRVELRIHKRRFFCKSCALPFTEPVPGVMPRRRTTQRYRADILWACENFTDLKRVIKRFQCSSGFLYTALYEQLEYRRRTRLYPWPKTIGIDEHSFARSRPYGRTEFASIIVDYKNKRIFDLVQGKTGGELLQALKYLPNPENVQNVVLDLSDPFKNFAIQHFPNATLVADKFHVLRLLNPALNKRRVKITGDRRTTPHRKILLKNGKNLEFFQRKALYAWLKNHPELEELYHWKERLHGFYRIKGQKRAAKTLTTMTDLMAKSGLKEIKTLRKTLMRWRIPILAYFKTGLTNGRTEGYNNLAKLIQRRAFGYKCFENYRLRLLNACA